MGRAQDDPQIGIRIPGSRGFHKIYYPGRLRIRGGRSAQIGLSVRKPTTS